MAERDIRIRLIGEDRASKQISHVASSISNMAAVAGGMIAAGVLTRVAGGIAQIGKSAFESVRSFEMLTLQMQALAAREIKATTPATDLYKALSRNKDATISMAQAFKMAQEPAKELIKWVQELAIKTPFDSDGVAKALQIGMTYNFSSEQAKELTKNVLSFAAATGQSVVQVSELMTIFGQIKAKGFADAMDQRQLSGRAFDIVGLAKKLGTSLQDLSKIDAEKFIQAASDMLGEDFTKILEESTNTWNGFLGALQDAKNIGIRNIFTGAFDAVKPFALQISNFLSSPEFLKKTEEIGKSIGETVTKIIKVMGDLKDGKINLKDIINMSGIDPKITDNVINQFTKLYENVKPVVTDLYNTIVEKLTPLQEPLRQFGNLLLDILRGDKGGMDLLEMIGISPEVVETVKTVFENIKAYVVPVLSTIFDAIKNNIGPAKEFFLDLYNTFIKTVKPAFDELSKVISENFGNMAPKADLFLSILKMVGSTLGFVFSVAGVVLASLVGIFAALVSAVMTGVSKIIPHLQRFWDGLTGIYNSVSTIIDGVTKIFNSFAMNDWGMLLDGVRTLFDGLYGLFRSGIGVAVEIFIGGLEAIAYGVEDFRIKVIEFFTNLYDELVGHSIIPDMLNAMQEWFSKVLANILKSVGTWIANVVRTIASKVSQFVSAGRSIINGLWTGAKAVWAMIQTWVTSRIDYLKALFSNISLVDIGRNIINGLLEGLKSMWTSVETWFSTLADQMPAWLKSALGIASPSKVMIEVGKNIVMGLGKGIGDYTPAVKDVMMNVSNTIAQAPVAAITPQTFQPAAIGYGDVIFHIYGATDPVKTAKQVERVMKNERRRF